MQDKLVTLCEALIAAKATEAEATINRIGFEEQILSITGKPDEGAATHDAPGFKIKVEQRINRKVDGKKWVLIADGIPEHLRPVQIVEEYKVETKGLRWLRDNEPGLYKLACSAMEEKPMKPSVKVEAV